jgi:SAM-dependent methyltransferase
MAAAATSLIPIQPIHQFQDEDLAVVREVFSNPTKIDAAAVQLVKEFIGKEGMLLIRDSRLPFCGISHEKIDLTNRDVLQRFIAPQFSNHLSDVASIVNRVYETEARPIPLGGGLIFPTNPEVLAHIAPYAKDEIVVEIAGATGENGILLAFAGANRVVINDKSSTAMQALRTELPPSVAGCVEGVEGDCFDLPIKKPEIMGHVGLLLCRNFIHFLRDELLEKFCSMVKGMLREGGRAVIMANCVYELPSCRHIFEDHPTTTTFAFESYFVADWDYGRKKSNPRLFSLLQEVTPSNSLDWGPSKLHELSWTGHASRFRWLNSMGRCDALGTQKKEKKFVDAWNKHREYLLGVRTGVVNLEKLWMRFFNHQTLSQLFEQHGFEIETTFTVDTLGHLHTNLDPYAGSKKIGIIIKSVKT